MAWGDLANNQWVSFTDAQGGGFSLNGGQSHVTSNQWMTKDDALTKYNINATSLISYTNNQWIPKLAWSTGTVYQSAVYSENATKSTCDVGATGSTVTLSAYLGQFTSTVSQIDADGQAVAWVQANKQSNANTNGVCTWVSIAKSGTFTRTNCGEAYTAGNSTYTVGAGLYSSTTSQLAADALAQADVDTNGQNHVNGITTTGLGSALAGTCTLRATAWRGQGSLTCETEAYYY